MRLFLRCAILFALLLLCQSASAENKIDLSFNGNYRIRGFYLRNGSLVRQLDPLTRQALFDAGVDNIGERQTFVDTRLRLSFNASRGKNLSLNTQFEIGDIVFGGNGGGLGTDGVNVETKWLFLQWTPGDLPLTFRGGLYSEETSQAIVLSQDVAGFKATYTPFDGALVLDFDFIKAVEQSRIDLDGDGLIDNDFNDRNIFIGTVNIAKLQPYRFGFYGIADVDNTFDTPAAPNVETDIYWFGAFLRGQMGIVSFSFDGLYAFGDIRNGAGPKSIPIEGFAVDGRISLSLPYVGIDFITGYGSGDDPDTGRNEAFPTISTFYAHSNIIFDDFGGFNITGSNLSGVAHLSAVVKTSPMPKLDVRAIVVYAIYTADPRRATNVNRLNLRGRELGLEVSLNADYQVNENLKFLVKSGVFFPGTGYLTTFDSPDDDLLVEINLGAQFNF